MSRVWNFSAGPAVLPEEVLRQAADEMLDWHGSGMGVMEMSHRGKEFTAIAAQAEADLRELLAVPAGYRVLFMQGGAIAENAIIPMNLMGDRRVADYVVTGSWSQKSQKEARKYAEVNIAASSEAGGFTTVPAMADWSCRPTRPTCSPAPTRPSAASSTPSSPTSRRSAAARCRWWPTCPRTSCRV